MPIASISKDVGYNCLHVVKMRDKRWWCAWLYTWSWRATSTGTFWCWATFLAFCWLFKGLTVTAYSNALGINKSRYNILRSNSRKFTSINADCSYFFPYCQTFYLDSEFTNLSLAAMLIRPKVCYDVIKLGFSRFTDKFVLKLGKAIH